MSPIEPPGPPPPAAPDAGGEETQLSEFFHTDDDLPRARRRRSHRGPIEASPFLERLLAPVTAVAVVIIVILLLIWINGGSAGTKQSNAAVGVRPAPSALAPSATQLTTPPAAVGPTKHPHATSKHTPHHKRAAQTAIAPLTVLNNSTRAGLAHSVASDAAHKGWHISQIGNLQRIVAKTTVYYAPGHHAAAVHLAHDFGSVQRVAPNHAGNMHGRGLTLVVTRSWRL